MVICISRQLVFQWVLIAVADLFLYSYEAFLHNIYTKSKLKKQKHPLISPFAIRSCSIIE